jgi:hypothetical protein
MVFPPKPLWIWDILAFPQTLRALRSPRDSCDDTGMSRLEQAQKRLTDALEKLEKAAELAAKRGKTAAHAEARVGALDGERERLLGRIAELEDELAVLSTMTLEVEGRLDGAIGEIRAALARQ